MKTRVCSKCKETLPATREFFSPRYVNGKQYWLSWCRKCHAADKSKRYYRNQTAELAKQKEITADNKAKVIALFGGRCNRCGFDDPRALQVDHINRAEVPHGANLRSGSSLYAAILNGKRKSDDLQLLCANCNWIKKIENNEGPRVRATAA